MSIQAMAWVLEHSEADGHDRLVLLAIANHANADGAAAWPSVTRIAAEARVDRATVYRALHRLVEIGELEITPGGGRGVTNQYRLIQSPPATESESETVAAGDKTVAPCDKTVAASTQNGRSSATQNRPNRPEPSRAGARATHPTLPPPLPDDVRARGAEFFRGLRNGQRPDE